MQSKEPSQKQDENRSILTHSYSSINSTTEPSVDERSPKSLLSKYREILKVRSAIEKKVRMTTREYLHTAYPGIKNIPPRGLKAKIESQSRARLFWESGIPELMKRAEEIWLELGDEW